ncbi:MAG: hypothetical protein AAGA30_17395, partial [Planctomycetota bacterium]
ELEVRYIVRIEVQASCDMPCHDEESDHLLEIDEILERLEAAESESISEEIYHRRKHDLCSSCYHEYKRNPLAMEPPIQIGFSDN